MKKLVSLCPALPLMLALAATLACNAVSRGSQLSQISTNGVLATSPASVRFGSVPTGTRQKQSVTITNTGRSTLAITQAAIISQDTTGFATHELPLPLTLAAGQSQTFEVSFQPQSIGNFVGYVEFNNNGQVNPVDVGFSGTGVIPTTLVTIPTSLSFGGVRLGSSKTQTLRILNSGNESLTLSAAGVSDAAFNVTGLTLPLTLAPNQSATFVVQFAPRVAGSSNSNLSLFLNGTKTSVDAALSGTGLSSASLIANSTNLAFSPLAVGTSQTLTEILQNAGHSRITISQASITGAPFGIAGPTLPFTLGPGESASFRVNFAPTVKGNFNGSVSFISDASDPSLIVSLGGSAAGEAVTPQTYYVDLGWTPSVSSDVIGYNIYRAVYGSSCGAYSKVGSSSNTTYTDSTATGGMTYCYAATTVYSINEESDYSSPVLAPIPLQ